MLKVIYALLLGLVGAGIVHIVILLLLPEYSDRDAWSRLAGISEIDDPARLDTISGQPALVAPSDPFFKAVACRFDLSDGEIHVKSSGAVPFWSVSVYDRSGQNFYSFNDGNAQGKVLDFLVLTPAQMVEVRKALPENLEKSVFVEAPVEEGIVVVRSFAPDQTWSQASEAFLGGIACRPET